MRCVTLLLTGVPQNASLTDLSYNLDLLFDTDEIGTFKIRGLPNHPKTNKRQIALDFRSGFDAMAAQEKLNGYHYELDDGREYTLHAKINQFEEYMRGESRSPDTSRNPRWNVEDHWSALALIPNVSDGELCRAHEKLDAQLELLKKQKLVIETEMEILREKRKLKREYDSMVSSLFEDPRRSLRCHKIDRYLSLWRGGQNIQDDLENEATTSKRRRSNSREHRSGSRHGRSKSREITLLTRRSREHKSRSKDRGYVLPQLEWHYQDRASRPRELRSRSKERCPGSREIRSRDESRASRPRELRSRSKQRCPGSREIRFRDERSKSREPGDARLRIRSRERRSKSKEGDPKEQTAPREIQRDRRSTSRERYSDRSSRSRERRLMIRRSQSRAPQGHTRNHWHRRSRTPERTWPAIMPRSPEEETQKSPIRRSQELLEDTSIYVRKLDNETSKNVRAPDKPNSSVNYVNETTKTNENTANFIKNKSTISKDKERKKLEQVNRKIIVVDKLAAKVERCSKDLMCLELISLEEIIHKDKIRISDINKKLLDKRLEALVQERVESLVKYKNNHYNDVLRNYKVLYPKKDEMITLRKMLDEIPKIVVKERQATVTSTKVTKDATAFVDAINSSATSTQQKGNNHRTTNGRSNEFLQKQYYPATDKTVEENSKVSKKPPLDNSEIIDTVDMFEDITAKPTNNKNDANILMPSETNKKKVPEIKDKIAQINKNNLLRNRKPNTRETDKEILPGKTNIEPIAKETTKDNLPGNREILAKEIKKFFLPGNVEPLAKEINKYNLPDNEELITKEAKDNLPDNEEPIAKKTNKDNLPRSEELTPKETYKNILLGNVESIAKETSTDNLLENKETVPKEINTEIIPDKVKSSMAKEMNKENLTANEELILKDTKIALGNKQQERNAKNEEIVTIDLDGTDKPVPKRPQFVLVVKTLVKAMNKVINNNNLGGDISNDELRHVLRYILRDLVKGQGYMTRQDILRKFRAQYPQNKDVKFLKNAIKDIKEGRYPGLGAQVDIAENDCGDDVILVEKEYEVVVVDSDDDDVVWSRNLDPDNSGPANPGPANTTISNPVEPSQTNPTLATAGFAIPNLAKTGPTWPPPTCSYSFHPNCPYPIPNYDYIQIRPNQGLHNFATASPIRPSQNTSKLSKPGPKIPTPTKFLPSKLALVNSGPAKSQPVEPKKVKLHPTKPKFNPACTKPADAVLVKPGPVNPGPAMCGAAKPSSTKPGSANTIPTKPAGPANLVSTKAGPACPVKTGPANAIVTKPDVPANPVLTNPGSAIATQIKPAGPAKAIPTKLGLVNPVPTKPGFATPGTSKPNSANRFPTKPGPADSVPTKPGSAISIPPNPAGPANPIPSKPVPARPGPANRSPAKSDIAKPDSSKSGPVYLAPTKPSPANPISTKPGPPNPGHANSDIAKLVSTKPGSNNPVKPGVANPGPSKSFLSKPGSTKPGPANSVPTKPGPANPVPNMPGLANPSLAKSDLTKPGPPNPIPTKPCLAKLCSAKSDLTASGLANPIPTKPGIENTGPTNQKPDPVNTIPVKFYQVGPSATKPGPSNAGPTIPGHAKSSPTESDITKTDLSNPVSTSQMISEKNAESLHNLKRKEVLETPENDNKRQKPTEINQKEAKESIEQNNSNCLKVTAITIITSLKELIAFNSANEKNANTDKTTNAGENVPNKAGEEISIENIKEEVEHEKSVKASDCCIEPASDKEPRVTSITIMTSAAELFSLTHGHDTLDDKLNEIKTENDFDNDVQGSVSNRNEDVRGEEKNIAVSEQMTCENRLLTLDQRTVDEEAETLDSILKYIASIL